LLVAVAMLLGTVIGGFGQRVVASHDLGVAMVDLAETMIARVQSLKVEDRR